YRREDAPEGRFLPFAFLPLDLLARGVRRWESLYRGVLYVLAGIAQSVVLPHGRLRHVSKPIVEMPLGIRGKLPGAQITVVIFAFRERLRIAELAHVPAVLVENDDQVWLAKRRHRNLSFGQRCNGKRILHGN